MYQKKYFGKIMLLVFSLSLFFTGCQGTRFVIQSEPPPKPSPVYKKGGPPPWAPAHGYRAKHKYRYYPFRIDVNDYVTLEMESNKPYEYDRQVVKRYPPGQLKKKHKKKGKGKWK
jgi:hypothetical protein